MEWLKTLLLLCILFVYPTIIGSFCDYIMQRKDRDTVTVKSVYISGVLMYVAIFWMITVVYVRFSLEFDFFKTITGILTLLLPAICLVYAVISARYRSFVVGIFFREKDSSLPWRCLGFVSYGMVALLYLIHPFWMADRFHTPEQVFAVLDTGFMNVVDEKISLLYACLCTWFDLKVPVLLFRVMPFVILAMSFCVISQIAEMIWGKGERERGIVLFLYALFTIFQNEAYMNPSHDLMLFPYEGITVLTCVILPYLPVVWFSSRNRLYVLVLLMNAILLSGMKRGLVLVGMEILCMLFASVIFFFRRRRNTLWN